MALPLARFAPRGPAENRAGAPLVVLFAGRFCEQKGLIYALEALRALVDAGCEIEFRVIGDETLTHGHYASRVYAYIRRHRLDRWVRLLGFVDYEAYLRELRAADVFIHPSVVDADGLTEGGAPTTILEAQALGVPVVSTWHCDIPNVTRPGESALLVPERDSAALARAVLRLAQDPQLRTRMGEAGRGLMEAQHDIAREALRLENRYAELLGRTIRDGADRHGPKDLAPATRS